VTLESTGPNCLIDLTEQTREGTGKVYFESLMYTSDNPSLGNHAYTNGSLEITVTLMANVVCSVGSMSVIIFDRYGTKLVNADTLSHGKPISLHEGRNTVVIKMDQLHLNPGIYTIGLWAADPPIEIYDYISSASLIEVIESEKENIRAQSDGLVPVKFQVIDIA